MKSWAIRNEHGQEVATYKTHRAAAIALGRKKDNRLYVESSDDWQRATKEERDRINNPK